MKRFFLSFSFLLGFVIVKAQIAQWTFEGVTLSGTAGTTPSITAGSTQADAGTLTAGSAFSGLHSSSSTAWNTPVGNGSLKSFSSNNWTFGDYYQFQFATTGYQDISITWDATGSGTGPRDFKVQYSTNGTIFTDATGANSTYSLTLDAWSSGSYNSVSTRTLNLSFVTALNNAPAVYVRLVCNSGTNINGMAIATTGTSRVDDFKVNGNTFTTNTITVTSVNTPPFTMPNCATGVGGSVDYSGTGTFNVGGTFTVQLSDNTGSFATPVILASAPVDGLDPVGNIIFTIPAGTVSGVAYRIRIVSNSPTVTSSLSSAFEIIQNGINGCMSAATDYFRSRQSGNWGTASTWESSPDNISWISPATLSPTSSANTILIRNSHTVMLAASQSADQLTIQNGGILNYNAGTFTINDDISGDDITIQSGGIFLLSQSGIIPTFGGSSTCNINTGGILRVSASGITGIGTGVNSSNFIYQHQSILDYTLTIPFSTSGVTFFPNVNAVTIPVFRTTNSGAISVGANSPNTTTINGVFENIGAGVVWQGSAEKIFRNGIRGAGNIDGQNGTTPSGKFIINGTTAELGGSGSLVLPTTNGLDIGSNLNNTLVTVTSNKTITGNVTLLSTNNTYVELGANNLTVTGTVSNGGQNAYIRTNGIGFLKLNLIGSTKTFPIGNTSYNPVIITNGSNNDFSARVENDINPGIAFPSFGINRTWSILASAATAGVNVTFQYATADANPGATPQPRNMEILMNPDPAGTAPWSIISGNGNIVPGGADPAWTIQTTSAIGINNARVAYALGTSGGYALSVDYFITAASQKRNNTGVISWKVFETANVASFEVQRSVGNSSFVTIGTVNPVNGQLDYHFTDFNLDKGTNLYRVKVNRQSGGSRYSNQVAVINGDKGFVITSIAPNPVQDIATVTISAAKQGGVDFKVYDLLGTVVRQWHSNISEGSNTISMNVVGLAAGTYHVLASSPDTRSVFRFIKQ